MYRDMDGYDNCIGSVSKVLKIRLVIFMMILF